MSIHVTNTFGSPKQWGIVFGVSRHPDMLIFWFGFFTVAIEWEVEVEPCELRLIS